MTVLTTDRPAPDPVPAAPGGTGPVRGAVDPGGSARPGRWCGARLVPAALGGSLTGVDALARGLRPVFRRDTEAGMALGAVPFSAAVPVWTAGSATQQARLAERLLGGGGISLSHEARSVREAFAAHGPRVRRGPGGLVLDGETDAFQGPPGWDMVLLHATVEPGAATRGGPALVLADLSGLPRSRVAVLPGRRLSFTGCPLPDDAVVGEPGEGPRHFLRALQISGVATSSMSLAAADACLRVAAGRLRQGPRTGGSLSARAAAGIVSGAFLDLLACDCLALAGTRAVGIVPEETSLLSAAVRSVVPVLLGGMVQDLAALLGPQSLSLRGAEPLFARHARHLDGLAAGAFIARAAVLPQLPYLARHAWSGGRPAPGSLFDPAGQSPAFEPGRPTLLSRSDGVSAVLAQDGPSHHAGGEPAELTRLVALLRGELAEITRHFAGIPHSGHSLVADPRSLAMADRYLLVLTAAACLGCFRQARDRGGFLAGPAWITGVLTRIARRLGLAVPALGAADARLVRDEVAHRLESAAGFDLHDTPLED